MNKPIPPVGSMPAVEVMFVGALMWSTPADAVAVLNLVADTDLGDPATAAVLAAIRARASDGKSAAAQLVLDELQRTGRLRGNVPDRLHRATTAGAQAGQARDLAAAVVAGSLRRQIESAGSALTVAAETAAEDELTVMVACMAETVLDTSHRLDQLRGEDR